MTDKIYYTDDAMILVHYYGKKPKPKHKKIWKIDIGRLPHRSAEAEAHMKKMAKELSRKIDYDVNAGKIRHVRNNLKTTSKKKSIY